jgi:hypothetical protein
MKGMKGDYVATPNILRAVSHPASDASWIEHRQGESRAASSAELILPAWVFVNVNDLYRFHRIFVNVCK